MHLKDSLLNFLYKSKEEKSSYKENEILQVSRAIKQNIYKNSHMVRYLFEDGDNWPDLSSTLKCDQNHIPDIYDNGNT